LLFMPACSAAAFLPNINNDATTIIAKVAGFETASGLFRPVPGAGAGLLGQYRQGWVLAPF
jgi:hypothetical protein